MSGRSFVGSHPIPLLLRDTQSTRLPSHMGLPPRRLLKAESLTLLASDSTSESAWEAAAGSGAVGVSAVILFYA
jgi:hypothetical protein